MVPLKAKATTWIGIGDGGSGYADTDLVGTASNPIDPLLGPLQDNGGPTQTMALLPGSPAIDAGAPTDMEWDQCGPGYARLVRGATDIGAYEVQDSADSIAAGARSPPFQRKNRRAANGTQPSFCPDASSDRNLHAQGRRETKPLLPSIVCLVGFAMRQPA